LDSSEAALTDYCRHHLTYVDLVLKEAVNNSSTALACEALFGSLANIGRHNWGLKLKKETHLVVWN